MKKISLLLVFTGASLFMKAQSSGDTLRWSLQQCLDYALQNEPNLKNSRLNAEIAHRQVQQITGLALPQISGQGQFQDFVQLPTSLIPAEFFGGEAGTFIPLQFGTQYNVTGSVTASQLIADGRYFLGLKATSALADLSRLNVERTQTDAIETVTKAYFTALISEVKLKQLQDNITAFKKVYDDTKATYDQGLVEKLDVDRLTVTYNNLITSENNVKNLVALGINLLKFQMGMDVKTPLALTDSISETDFEAILDNTVNTDPNNRIEYQILQTSRSLSLMDIKRHQLEYLPSLYGFGSLSYVAQRDQFNFFDSNQKWYPTGVIGLTLNVPIFDGLQKARLIQAARLTLEKDENNISAFENAMNLQVQNARSTMQNAIASLQIQNANLGIAKEVFSMSQKKYNAGVGSTLEVTDAQNGLNDAQANYLNALYDAWVAKIDLQKALGTLGK